MAEDEEDIFIIDSSPEPNTAVRNSSLERNTAARNSAPEVNHNVGEVAENIDENEINIQTSPIIATSRYCISYQSLMIKFRFYI